jgi:hypothetical protein
MDYMTKLDGVPSKDDAIDGMAFFAGTGPYGKTCGDCKFRGYTRQSSKGVYNETKQEFVYRTYRTTKCEMFRKLSGHHGSEVKEEYPVCKYFEQKKK